MFEFHSWYLDDEVRDGRVFDVFQPEKITQDHAFFFVHGGGWGAGSRTGYCSGWHRIMRELGKRGFLCATTDYRLRGVTALDQLADIRESYSAFTQMLPKRRTPLKIAVFGESAGAHLASLLSLAKPGECGEKVSLHGPWIPPECVALQSTPASFEPWDEIFPQVWSSMQGIAGKPYKGNEALYRALSMSAYLRKDNPRVFFLEAENEHMFPTRYNREFVRRHQEMGIPSQLKVYPNMEHGFLYSLERPRQREAFEDLIRFVCGETVK